MRGPAALLIALALLAGCLGGTTPTTDADPSTTPSASATKTPTGTASGTGTPSKAPKAPASSSTSQSKAPSTSGSGTTAPAASPPQASGPEDRLAPRPPLAKPTTLPDRSLSTDDPGEPNIAVGPNGTIYIAPINPIFRTTDGGATWKQVATPDGGGDGDIVVDGDGNLYWLGLFGDAGAIPFQVSKDRGETFSAAIDLSDNKGTDREWLDGLANGTLYAYWRDDRGLVFRNSWNGGEDWNPPVIVRGDVGANGPLVHDPVHPGRIAFAYPANGVSISISDDHGATWREETVTSNLEGGVSVFFTTSIFPVAAFDTAGTLYVVWSSSNPTLTGSAKQAEPQAIFLTYSLDVGETWSAPLLISDPAKDARMPWITAGRPGRVAVAWYESVVDALPGEFIPNEWNVRLWQSNTADAPAPVFEVVQLNTDTAHIGSVCTAGLLCVAGGDRSLLDFFEIAVGPNGLPVATWMSTTLGTGVGVAVSSSTHFGGLATGTPLV